MRGAWASDGIVSLPQPLESTEVDMVDFEGFCFTPDGIRINLSQTDREAVLAEGFTPKGVNGG